jgi:hypothetical protein
MYQVVHPVDEASGWTEFRMRAKAGRQRMHYSNRSHSGDACRLAAAPQICARWSSPNPPVRLMTPPRARPRLGEAVAETVRKQHDCGIDVVNDSGSRNTISPTDPAAASPATVAAQFGPAASA